VLAAVLAAVLTTVLTTVLATTAVSRTPLRRRTRTTVCKAAETIRIRWRRHQIRKTIHRLRSTRIL
jgi:hypothetical protein